MMTAVCRVPCGHLGHCAKSLDSKQSFSHCVEVVKAKTWVIFSSFGLIAPSFSSFV